MAPDAGPDAADADAGARRGGGTALASLALGDQASGALGGQASGRGRRRRSWKDAGRFRQPGPTV